MKKIKLFLFVLLSLFIMQATGQVINSFPWVETFEEDSETRDDWTQSFESGTNEWTFNDGSSGTTFITSAYEGDLNAMFTSSSGGPHITKFVTPVLDLSEFTVYNLSFWYGQPNWFTNQNELKLYYRISDSDPWVEIDHLTQAITEWTEFNYELPEPSATYQIAFEGIDDYGRANVIDMVTVSHLSDDNDIISFTFPEEVFPAIIDSELKTVHAQVLTGTDLTSLTPVIEVSDLATVSPESEVIQNFESDMTYIVTAESGLEQEWTVTVTEADPQSNEKEILTFTLPEQTGPAIINNIDFTLEIEVENPTDVTNLTPTITVSDEATIDPQSGTNQNFGFPVVYTVTAENLTTQEWTVYVTMEQGALGADCTNPIIVNLPIDTPFLDQEQTNCGLNNVYSGLDCGGSYFNGEDIVYQINITEAVLATFELTTTSTYTGIALLDACPNVGTCIDFSTGSGSNKIMEDIALYPGTYYLIISTWPTPDCIPSFDLNITIDEDACPVPTDIVVENITPDEVTISWTQGFIESEWNIAYGEFPIDPDTEGTLIENHTSQSITITDLTEDTNYQLYVAAVCGIDNTSDWTEGFHFKTLENCPAPSDIVSENPTHSSVDLSWTEGELNNTWTVEIGLPGFTPGSAEEQVVFTDIIETNLFADGLDPATGYAVYLQADCGVHNSAWVGPHFFDTYAVCPVPTNITAQNATNFSVDIVWNETYNNDSWDVEVGPVGFTPGNGEELFSITGTNETSWHVSGLESGTDYQAFIKATCGAEESNWSEVIEFSTITCPDNAICIYYTQGDIPSDRDLTSLPGFSNCPSSVTVNIPDNNWITGIDTEYDITAHGGAYMSEARSYIYSPTAGAGEPELATGGTTSAGTFSYSRNNLDFANYTYGTVEFQMHAGRTWGGSGCNSDYIYVNDNTWLLTIHYDLMPDCVPPIGVTISDLTGVSATINWNESISDVDGYNWVIMAEGENPDLDTPIDMGTTDGTTTSVAITGLSPITEYDVYLNSICDSENSDWFGPYSFMTDCDVFAIPIFEDFDGAEINTPDLPICWDRIENTSSDFANVNTSTVNSNSDPNNIRFYNSDDADAKLLLITPSVAQSLNELYTTFSARNTNEDSHLLVGTISDINDYTTFTVVDTVYLTTTHTEYEVYFNEVTNTDVKIAFKHLIGGTYKYVYLDDIEIKEIPECPHVSNLSVSNIEIESVLLSWNEIGDATLWNIEIGYPGFEPGTGAELFLFEETDQNPLFIDGLTDNTSYEAFVQAVCTEEELSEWSNSITFTTSCITIVDFPFIEDFSNDGMIPDCWENEPTNDRDWEFFTSTTASGGAINADNTTGDGYFAYFNSWSSSNGDIGQLTSPTLAVDLLNTPVLEFYWNRPTDGYTSRLVVNIYADGQWHNDLIPNLTGQTNGWENVIFDLSDYMYNDFKVQFKVESDWWRNIGLDDVIVRDLSDENHIIDFVFAQQTTPAIITGEPDYTVVIEVSAAADLNGLVPNITISDYASINPESGLPQDFSTPVEYIVTSESGIDQEWTIHVTNAAGLLSDNDIIAFSFNEETGPAIINNDDKTVDIEINWLANLATLVPEIEISNLATIDPPSGVAQNFTEPFEYVVTAEDESEAIWTINVSQEEAPYGATCNNPIIINLPAEIPFVDTDQTTCLLGNVYNNIDCGGTYFNGEDIVYQINVTQDMVFNFDLTTESTWTGIAILDECPDTGSCIAFSISTGGDESLEEVFLEIGTYYLIISTSTSVPCIPSFDLSISVACPQPINLAIEDIMQEEIWVSWEAEYVEEEWNILYGETGFDIETEGTLDQDATSPHHITGLTEETEYDVYVQSVCGVYGDSEWTGPVTVTTLASCPAPIDLYVENVTDVSVDIGWFGIGGTTIWNVEVGAPGFTVDNDEELFVFANISDNPLFIDGLTPETSYQFYVQSVCNGDVSVWTGPFSFATICSNCLVENYADGDIPTDYQTPWVGPSTCPVSMFFDIPAGNMVTGIDVSYNMTAFNGAWMSEQRSALYSPTIEAGEAAYATGAGTTAGTFSYDRTGLTFANGATGTLEIEMHAGRTWGGTGCNTEYNYVVNNSLTITVHYQPIPQLDVIDVYGDVQDIDVCILTSEEVAISQLAETITISDSEGGEHLVDVTWTIDSYDGNVAATYNATGTFELPGTVIQTDPVTTLEVYATVTVVDLPIVNCPDDMDVCVNDEGFELTTATPEGGVYTGDGVAGNIFNPAFGGSTSLITYTYVDPVTNCVNTCQFTINVHALPTVTCPEDFIITENVPYTLEGATPAGGEYSGTNVVDGVFNPDGLEDGDYVITYTYVDPVTGCENFCEFTITRDVGVGLITNNNGQISIFPNPNSGDFVIDLNNITGDVQFNIYDTKGSIIASDKFSAAEDSNREVSINVAPGIYYIKLINAEETIIEKIVIQ